MYTANAIRNICLLGHSGEDIGLAGTAWGDYQDTLALPEGLAGGFVEGLLVVTQTKISHN